MNDPNLTPPIAGFISPPHWFDPSPAEFQSICADPVAIQQIEELAPVAIPQITRPGASSSICRNALAMTEGWRVTGLVTPVTILVVVVLSAHAVHARWTSRSSTEQSDNEMAYRPFASTARAVLTTLDHRPCRVARQIWMSQFGIERYFSDEKRLL